MTLPARLHRPLRTAGVLALLAASSCAAIAAIEANRRLPAVTSDGVLTPSRPQADKLGADPTRTCPTGGAYGEVETRLAAAARDRGAVEVVADGRLCAVAEALLAWQGEEVPLHVRAFLGRYFGLAGGPPELVLVTLDTDDPRLLGERLAETILGHGVRAPWPRYGVATSQASGRRGGDTAIDAEGSSPRTRAALALHSETMKLDPLPRRLEIGQRATLSGILLGDLENPRVLVSDVQGRLATVEPPPGKAFSAELACGDRPGRVVAEIRGEAMGSPRVLGTLTVACGGPALPRSVPLAPPAAWPADAALQEAMIAELVNAERDQAGLPPLTLSEPVGKIARAVAESMRDGARKGAPSVPVNVVQRLREADIATPVVLQNPAAAATSERAMERLMVSPSHRASLMSTEVTHFGAGVALGEDASGKPVAYLTQIFITVLPPPDLVAYKSAVRDAIARKRAAARLAPAASDPDLDQLAQEYAAAVAAAEGKPARDRYEALVRALNKGYRGVELLTSVKPEPADHAEEPSVLSRGKLMGLGAALGRHPVYGKNSVFLVLLVASKR